MLPRRRPQVVADSEDSTTRFFSHGLGLRQLPEPVNTRTLKNWNGILIFDFALGNCHSMNLARGVLDCPLLGFVEIVSQKPLKLL